MSTSIPYISSIGCIVQSVVYIFLLPPCLGFVQNEKSSVLIFTILVRWVKINVSIGHERSKQLPYSLSLRVMVHAAPVSCSPPAAPLMGLVRPKLETLCMLTIDGNVAV